MFYTDKKSAHLHLKFSKSTAPVFHFPSNLTQCSKQRAWGQRHLGGSQQQQKKFKPHWAKCPKLLGESLRMAVEAENSWENPYSKSLSIVFLENLVNINVASLPTKKKQKGLKLCFTLHPDSSNLSEATDAQTWCWLRTDEVQFPRKRQFKKSQSNW